MTLPIDGTMSADASNFDKKLSQAVRSDSICYTSFKKTMAMSLFLNNSEATVTAWTYRKAQKRSYLIFQAFKMECLSAIYRFLAGKHGGLFRWVRSNQSISFDGSDLLLVEEAARTEVTWWEKRGCPWRVEIFFSHLQQSLPLFWLDPWL